MLTYEQMLDGDTHLPLQEGSMHFEESSAVHKTLRKIVGRLEALGIHYAVVGGMAMFLHGSRRFTEDVHILVDREGLKRLHDELKGRGYLPPFAGSKHPRDAEFGVKIEFLVTGDYPGDGKPKPVSFPDPEAVSEEVNQVRVLKLDTLIALKLASGMTNPGRMKDLADVQEMIRTLKLALTLQDRLDPFVREKYREL